MLTPSFHPFRSEQDKVKFTAMYRDRAKAWPIPCETTVLDTPCGQTFVRASGRPSDPPLVLLPGARGTSLMPKCSSSWVNVRPIPSRAEIERFPACRNLRVGW